MAFPSTGESFTQTAGGLIKMAAISQREVDGSELDRWLKSGAP